jgi:hypothetical protein
MGDWARKLLAETVAQMARVGPEALPRAFDRNLAKLGLDYVDLYMTGDDLGAKAEVRKIIEQTGHFPVDLALDVGGPLASLPFGSLATINSI